MYVITGVEFIFFDKSLNFVCKNSKLKNEPTRPGLLYFVPHKDISNNYFRNTEQLIRA